MKLSGVAVGLCSLLLIACAADAPDTYAAKEPDSTGLGSSATTTTTATLMVLVLVLVLFLFLFLVLVLFLVV